jgi:hypothetical protein
VWTGLEQGSTRQLRARLAQDRALRQISDLKSLIPKPENG